MIQGSRSLQGGDRFAPTDRGGQRWFYRWPQHAFNDPQERGEVDGLAEAATHSRQSGGAGGFPGRREHNHRQVGIKQNQLFNDPPPARGRCRWVDQHQLKMPLCQKPQCGRRVAGVFGVTTFTSERSGERLTLPTVAIEDKQSYFHIRGGAGADDRVGG